MTARVSVRNTKYLKTLRSDQMTPRERVVCSAEVKLDAAREEFRKFVMSLGSDQHGFGHFNWLRNSEKHLRQSVEIDVYERVVDMVRRLNEDGTGVYSGENVVAWLDDQLRTACREWNSTSGMHRLMCQIKAEVLSGMTDRGPYSSNIGKQLLELDDLEHLEKMKKLSRPQKKSA